MSATDHVPPYDGEVKVQISPGGNIDVWVMRNTSSASKEGELYARVFSWRSQRHVERVVRRARRFIARKNARAVGSAEKIEKLPQKEPEEGQ